MSATTRSKRFAVVIAAAALAVVATACAKTTSSGSAAPNPTPSSANSTTAAPTTTTTPPKKLTPQGFLPKQIGQLSGLDCTSDLDTCAIKFTVNKIEVNPQCSQYGTSAAAGRKTVLLHVSMATGNLSTDGAIEAPMIFNPFSLKGIGTDGFVHEAQPGTCTDYDTRLAHDILPNSKYEGTVEVEVSESASSIASNRQPDRDGGRGWVWEIGG